MRVGQDAGSPAVCMPTHTHQHAWGPLGLQWLEEPAEEEGGSKGAGSHYNWRVQGENERIGWPFYRRTIHFPWSWANLLTFGKSCILDLE